MNKAYWISDRESKINNDHVMIAKSASIFSTQSVDNVYCFLKTNLPIEIFRDNLPIPTTDTDDKYVIICQSLDASMHAMYLFCVDSIVTT